MVNANEALELISKERNRQIAEEGWSADHDDRHDEGEMLTAAVGYIWHGTIHGNPDGSKPLGWPWDEKWWKPKNRLSNLVRAGALCMAEHDRLIRAGLPTGPADHKLAIAVREISFLSAEGATP